MKRKEAVYKGLQFIPIWFEDTSLTSPDYFQISEFPTRLTAGKNLFKLRGNPTNLKVGGFLNIEVLDYNGDPIYSEVIDYIDEDKSRVVAIYIYEETSPGDCTITLVAEADAAPAQWQGKANVRWTRSVPVNPNVSNISEIIFETLPTLQIQEQVGVQLDRVYTNGQFPTYNTGTAKYFLYNGQPAIEIIGGLLTSDMKSGTVTVSSPLNPTPTPIYTPSTTTYTSTIKKILSPTVALLDTLYTVYSSQSISEHTYNTFDASAYSISYEATPDYVPTQNSESFALVQINNLSPSTGDVSRVKLFVNSNGTIGTWELINDIELEETEIFVSSTSSMYPDQSIGSIVSQSIIDTYWNAHTYIGAIETTAPTLTFTTQSLNNSMIIQNNVNINANNAVSVAQINSAYRGIFIEKSEYKVTIDAIGTVSGSNSAVLSLYLSGSSFDYDSTDYFNQDFPVKLGKRIGELRVTGTTQRFDDVVFNFESDSAGTGVLLLVVESGLWQVADIRTTTDNDSGYSPNYTRFRTMVPTVHKSDNQLTFKTEYYNVNGEKSKQISYVYNKNWEGGNRYIDGDYSMLTGSLYVADSLETGVAISGYKNTGYIRSLGYEGFTAGFPGFLMWSGSALSGSLGTKGGVPYSGVGLELYGDANNYFRYATNPSELDVHTETFFLGDPNSQYISGSNGNLEISSSGFYLTANGDVTASSFLAVNGSDVLFDSNSEFVDGINVGRVVYFNRDEWTYTGDLTTNPQTSSIFETFILPGETKIQVSLMYEFDAAINTLGSLRANWYIQSASFIASTGVSLPSGYDVWSTSEILDTGGAITITGIDSINPEGGARTINISTTSIVAKYQGKYCRIYMITERSTNGNVGDVAKLKGFIYRTSRSVGGAIGPLPGGAVL
jgi:hypothetical protein